MSVIEWIGAMAAVGAGAVLQGAVGFGANLIAVPLLVLIEPDLVPVPSLLGGLALNVLMVRRDGSAADRTEVSWALAGRIPGTLLAVAAVTAIAASTLDLFFALLLLAAVGLSALPVRFEPRPATLVGVGSLSGFMATTVGIGGPPLALLYQHGRGTTLRGTLAPVFSIGAVMSLLALGIGGHATAWQIAAGLALAPAAAIGFYLSGPLADRLDKSHTRVAVLTVSGLAALAVLIRTLW